MNKEKRIAIVVNTLAVGGVSKVVVQLCNSFPADSFELHLILLSPNTQMLDIMPLRKDIKIHFINYEFSSDYSLSSYLKDAFIEKRFEQKSKEFIEIVSSLELNILHFHTLPRQLMLGILAKKRFPDIRLIYTDHSLRISPDAYQKHQRVLLALAYRKLYKHYHLVAVSKSILNFFKQFNLVGKGKYAELLENSISIEDYTKTNLSENLINKSVVYVSRMNRRKGQDDLIKAWKTLPEAIKNKLYLVGPDETDGYLESLTEGDSSIIFTGSIEDVKPYLNQASVGVFPSYKEGLPLSLLEMMAFELPIIVSNIPELTSIIEENQEGLHFETANPNDLANKLKQLLSNDTLIQTMGKNSRKKVEDLCKKNNPKKFYLEFYERVTT